jgi:hypothetical protein
MGPQLRSKTATVGRPESAIDRCSEATSERHSEAVMARAELGAKVGERGPETMADVGWIGNWCSGQDYWGSTHSFCFDGLQDGEGTLVI